MQITESELFAYIECPVYYQIQYERQQITAKKTLKKLIEQVVQYFFVNLLNGKVKTYKELQIKWDKLCKDMPQLTHQEVIKGWGTIIKIVEYAQNEKLIVGDVACTYRLPVGTHQIVGQIPIVLVFPDKHIELLYFDYGEKHLDKDNLIHLTKYSLDYFGFKSVYEIEPQYVKIHQVKYNEDVLLTKSIEDWQRLQAALSGVCKCLEQKIYFPRETLFCKSCPAHYFCGYWKP